MGHEREAEQPYELVETKNSTQLHEGQKSIDHVSIREKPQEPVENVVFVGPSLRHSISPDGYRPFAKKTPRMLSLEENYGEPVGDILERLYQRENRRKRDICKEIGISLRTLQKWLDALGIPARNGEEIRALKSESLKKTWEERRDELTQKVHTPKSREKRRNSLRTFYDQNPEARKKIGEKARENHIKKHNHVFGNDIRAKLYDLHHQKAMPVSDISVLTGYTEGQIVALLHRYGVPHIRRSNQASVHRFQEVQRLLWSDPGEFFRLTKRQQDVISKRFLREGRIPSFGTVAKELGITRQAVKEQEEKALIKLRNPKKKK